MPVVARRLLTVIAGAVFGLLSGALVALAIIALIPGDHATGLRAWVNAFGWAMFFGSPGILVGAALGVFLHLRARRVNGIQRLCVEATCFCVVASVAAVQVLLPIAWELPRGKIAVITVAITSISVVIGTWALRPLYWPTDRT